MQVEAALGDELIMGLAKLGHKPVPPPSPVGGSQAIWIDWNKGTLTGGSDPRKDGYAAGY